MLNFFLEISDGDEVVKNLSEIVDIPINSLKNEFEEEKNRILIFQMKSMRLVTLKIAAYRFFPDCSIRYKCNKEIDRY